MYNLVIHWFEVPSIMCVQVTSAGAGEGLQCLEQLFILSSMVHLEAVLMNSGSLVSVGKMDAAAFPHSSS